LSSTPSGGEPERILGRILVVDDERDILELISFNLEKEGFAVEKVRSGEEALTSARTEPPAAIVLDLMLPGVDGLSVCKRLKADENTRAVPIIMLTAKSEDSDVVAGLEIGADDYVTKPFSPRVLLARLRAALRRASDGLPEDEEGRIRVGDVTIDVSRHEVMLGEERIGLSATEFAILEFLARNPGWVFSRDKIIDAVKGKDYPVTERSVDVQILGIRRKLRESGKMIETVRGVGYRLQAE
jgi:two-component system phosphate regulon response regulator PhoB